MFLGVVGKSGEWIVGDAKGVWKTRTVHRKPHGERWDPLVQPLWRTSDMIRTRTARGHKLKTLTGHKFQETVKDEQSMPRRVNLNKNDFEEHGYSSSWTGCPSILKGIGRQGHSDICTRILRGGFKKRGQEAEACREVSGLKMT